MVELLSCMVPCSSLVSLGQGHQLTLLSVEGWRTQCHAGSKGRNMSNVQGLESILFFYGTTKFTIYQEEKSFFTKFITLFYITNFN